MMNLSSSPPLEKELKYFLNREDYIKLLRVSKKRVIKKVRQTNYYFDGPRLQLRKRKIGLRLRIEDGQIGTITLKEPSRRHSIKVPKLKVRHEWETKVPLELAKDILKEKRAITSLRYKPIQILKNRLSYKSFNNISLLGSVKTIRTFVAAESDVLLEIDKFKMFQKRFYELEVETQDPELADKVVRTLLKKHKIKCRPITKSKLGRFIDLWKKENKWR
jgi:uncharacterized protein YjbK